MSAQLEFLPNRCAAIYLRSSKDRSDVSIDSQRRKLQETATRLNLTIVEEFVDAVESGKDDDRPGYQQMLFSIRNRDRRWQHLIALDTSRIARSRYIALAIENDCRKVGITMHFANIPDMDEITGVLVKSVFQAMDEVHSLTSRAKGLAGMAENIQRGFRAGGKAPRGYDLQHIETGVIREGKAVTKSKLAINSEAEIVRAYLIARAKGEARNEVMSRLRLSWSQSSLVGMEWQALTYAGHTVWGVHNPVIKGQYNDGVKGKNEYKNGTKRRPRSEWKISKDTHEPLITNEQAEALLSKLENKANTKASTRGNVYLLTGLLETPQGERWHGDWKNDAPYYRLGKGQRVLASAVDQAVVKAVHEQMLSEKVVQQLLKEISARARAFVPEKKAAGWRRRINELMRKTEKMVDQLIDADETLRPVIRRNIEAAENERIELTRLLEERDSSLAVKLNAQIISESEVRAALKTLLTSIEDVDGTENVHKKHALMQIVERVELPEKSETLRVHLSIPSLRSDELNAGFYANEITNDRTFGNKKPPITGVKGGDTGVPTELRFFPPAGKPYKLVLTARWVDFLNLSNTAINKKVRKLQGLPPSNRGWRGDIGLSS